jgi:gliding motility-associated-like protein
MVIHSHQIHLPKQRILIGVETAAPQRIVSGRRDTVQYTYNTPGTYYIFARGSDAPVTGQPSCDIVLYPDTPNMKMIKVVVVDFKSDVLIDKDVVCKDPDLAQSSPVTITNNSDSRIINYKYFLQRTDDSTTFIDSTVKVGMPHNFKQAFPDTGYYRIIAKSGAVDPGLPQNCGFTDTLNVRVVSPYPSFEIDTMNTPEFKMKNTSDTTLNNRYEWVAYKQGTTTVLFSKSGGNKDLDFSFDLQNDTGTFVVCLTAFATGIEVAEACEDSVCQLVKSNFNPDLQIPNVFSPNGDGSNDVVRIPHESVETFKMTIYNRWGAKVFETSDVEIYWNGKVNNDGAESPSGVYYFIAEYKLRSMDKVNRTGTITLIR